MPAAQPTQAPNIDQINYTNPQSSSIWGIRQGGRGGATTPPPPERPLRRRGYRASPPQRKRSSKQSRGQVARSLQATGPAPAASRVGPDSQIEFIQWDKVEDLLEASIKNSDNGIVVYADSAQMALQQGRLKRQKWFTASETSQTLQSLRTWRGLGKNLVDSTDASDENPDADAMPQDDTGATLKEELKGVSVKAMQMCKRRRPDARGVVDTACDDRIEQSNESATVGQGDRRMCPLRVFAMPVCLKFDGSNTVCSLNESRTSQPKLDARERGQDNSADPAQVPASPRSQARRKYNTNSRALNDRANNAYRALFRPVNLHIPEELRKIIKTNMGYPKSIWNSRLQQNISQAAADHIGRFVNHVHAVRAYVGQWPFPKAADQRQALGKDIQQVVKQYEWDLTGNHVKQLTRAEDEDEREDVIDKMLERHLQDMKKLLDNAARKQRADRIRAWTRGDGEGLIRLETSSKEQTNDRSTLLNKDQWWQKFTLLNRKTMRTAAVLKTTTPSATKPWETLKDAIIQAARDLKVALAARPQVRCTKVFIVGHDNTLETWGFPVTDRVRTAVEETVKMIAQNRSMDSIQNMLAKHADAERNDSSVKTTTIVNQNTVPNSSAATNDQSRLNDIHALVNGNAHFSNEIDTMQRTWLASLLLLYIFRRELTRAGATSQTDLHAWSIGEFGTCIPYRLVYAFAYDIARWRRGIIQAMQTPDAADGATSAILVLANNWGGQRTKHVPIPTDAGFFTIMSKLSKSVQDELLKILQPIFDAGYDWVYSCSAPRADLTSLCLATAAQVDALGITDTTALNHGNQKTTVLQTSRRIGSIVPGGAAYGIAQYTVPVTTVLSDIGAGCVPIGRAIKRVATRCPREYRGILNTAQQTALKSLRKHAGGCEHVDVPSDVGLANAYHRVVQSWAAIDIHTQNRLQDETNYKNIAPTDMDSATGVFLKSLQEYGQMYNSVKDRRAEGYWIATGAPKPREMVATALAYNGAQIILHCALDENDADVYTGDIQAKVLVGSV